MTHWSKVTKAPVRLDRSCSEKNHPISLLANDRTPEEARAMWMLGPDLLLTSCSGINTKLGTSQADNLRWSKMTDLELGASVLNESLSSESDVANGIVHGYRALTAESGLVMDTALRIKQVWMSYFEVNPKGLILHSAHSGGAAHTLNALKGMPQHLCQRITVLLSRPQNMIGDRRCKQIIHIGSDKDKVFKRARDRCTEKCSDVSILNSKVKRDLDHANRSDTSKQETIDALDELKRDIKCLN